MLSSLATQESGFSTNRCLRKQKETLPTNKQLSGFKPFRQPVLVTGVPVSINIDTFYTDKCGSISNGVISRFVCFDIFFSSCALNQLRNL